MKVKKVYNNSVVLGVDADGQEAVLFGAGLGYALSPGMKIDPAKIERTFRPEGDTSVDRLATLLREIPLSDIDLTESILREAKAELNTTATAHVLIPLADHISFALQRAREGAEEVEYPLRWEVQHLYPSELRFAQRALELIAARTGITLPETEAIPLALHFVNAHLSSGDISDAMKLTGVLAEALRLVKNHLTLDIDENSLHVARLVTHLRYLYLRQQQGTMPVDSAFALGHEIRGALPREYECARDVAALLSSKWNTTITPDETFYLTLHIGRLSAAIREQNGTRP